MIQVQIANNSNYNTSDSSLQMKLFLNQISTTENLREQIVNQIYIITNIQKSINNDTIELNLKKFLIQYNNSISNINSAIVSYEDKLSYFDVEDELLHYDKQQFTTNLALRCQEVEEAFNKVASLNAQIIEDAKLYISAEQSRKFNPLKLQ